MPKKPNAWTHKLSLARLQRAKDVAEVAELHARGLTFQEIAAKMGRSTWWAWRRNQDAVEHYVELATEAIEKRNATHRRRHEMLYREAVAGWFRSVEDQEKRRAKVRKRPGPKGEAFEQTEEEMETRKVPGDPRFIEAAGRQLLAMQRLDGVADKHELVGKDGAPTNFFELLMLAQRTLPPVVGEDGGIIDVEGDGDGRLRLEPPTDEGHIS